MWRRKNHYNITRATIKFHEIHSFITKQWRPQKLQLEKKLASKKVFTVKSKDILRPPFVGPLKGLLHPLNIELGFVKQFVNILNEEGACFKNIVGKVFVCT